ncbi:MAG: methyltransferase domain-containing protein [Kofleriaceae bacterium]|nr:methyltransferase domain-containing protein [Kofleriaceae bacterium]
MMGWLGAKLYDRLMRGAESKHFSQWRREALSEVRGDVLEIGAGTGANLRCYGEAPTRLVLLEPDKNMRKQLLAKLAGASGNASSGNMPDHIEVGTAYAENLPYEDDSFDWVVSTLVLCSVRDPEAALKELHRVLRPGGKLAFVEHVLDYEDHANRRRQRRWQPVWGMLTAHCQVIRDTGRSIEECGFQFETLERDRLRLGPKIVRPVIRGRALAV